MDSHARGTIGGDPPLQFAMQRTVDCLAWLRGRAFVRISIFVPLSSIMWLKLTHVQGRIPR